MYSTIPQVPSAGDGLVQQYERTRRIVRLRVFVEEGQREVAIRLRLVGTESEKNMTARHSKCSITKALSLNIASTIAYLGMCVCGELQTLHNGVVSLSDKGLL